MTKIQVPGMKTVAELVQRSRYEHEEPSTRAREGKGSKSRLAIANEVGSAATGSGLDSITSLFEIELLERIFESSTSWKVKRSGIIEKCFNDFTTDVPVNQILKVEILSLIHI